MSVSKELTTVMPTPHVPIGSAHLIVLVTLVTPVLGTFVLISMSVLLCSVPPWVVLIHAQRTVSVPTLTDHTLALARLVSLVMDSHAKILMNVPTSTLVPMLPTLPASTQLVASTAPVTPDGSRAQTDNVPILTSVTLLLVVLTLPALTLKAHTNANVTTDTATLLKTPLTVFVKILMSVLSRLLSVQPTVSA